jgi:hypothetical protein
MTKRKQVDLPDFQTYEERDKFFAENAQYFTLVRKAGVGRNERDELNSLAEAERLAQTKKTVGGGSFMIYAVIGEQSALVKVIR